jgi:hypothetical protein
MTVPLQITVAAIGWAGAISGPIATFLLTQKAALKGLETNSKARQLALTGKWKGIVHQEIGINPHPIDYRLTVKLVAKEKEITGMCTLYYVDAVRSEEHILVIVGGFYNDRYLQLNYKSTDTQMIEFGAIILRLSDDASRLEGRFAGYGSVAQNFTSGTLVLSDKSLS